MVIPGALHCEAPLSELAETTRNRVNIPSDRVLICICQSGPDRNGLSPLFQAPPARLFAELTGE